MGTFSQGITPSALPLRSSLKAPAQVRWPVNLNQLAALSLDDDSDLDHSFSDVAPHDEIGSVKLLRMLKDSDDESASLPPSKLRRPRSIQAPPQKLVQQQLLQKGGIPVARSSSLHSVQGSQSALQSSKISSSNILRPPQRTRSENKGSSPSTAASAERAATLVGRPMGLRPQPSDPSLVGVKRPGQGQQLRQQQQQQRPSGDRPELMEQIFSEANAIAQQFSTPSPASSSGISPLQSRSSGIRGPGQGIRAGTIPAAASASTNVLRKKPGSTPSPFSPPPSGNSMGGSQARSRLSAPSKISTSAASALPSVSGRAQRMSAPIVVGPRQDSRPKDAISPTRTTQGSPNVSQPIPSTSGMMSRKLVGPQQSPLSRPAGSRQSPAEGGLVASSGSNGVNSFSTSAAPSAAMSTLSYELEMMTKEAENRKMMVLQLNEELERRRIQLDGYRQERNAIEGWKKQIKDLERDLETALDSLQSTEAQAIAATAQEKSTRARLGDYDMLVEELKNELEAERQRSDHALQDAEEGQRQNVIELESRNNDLEARLTQAHNEIEQLELQVVPAEIQDIHQALFSATQELDETKEQNRRLTQELNEEKAKIAREQEDAGQLLVKISQLQDTISNHLRDNNALKNAVKEHERCQENAEAIDYQHKKELERLQAEMFSCQQELAQEKEHHSALASASEQALHEHQYQAHQLQQQFQLQQIQLHQQQTEIVNLKASLEIEQRQVVLFQQRLQEEQRQNNNNLFGRRASVDADPNGSFYLPADSVGVSGGNGVASAALLNMGLNLSMNGSDRSLNTMSNVGSMTGGPPQQQYQPTATSNVIRNFDGSMSSSATASSLSNNITASESDFKSNMAHRNSAGSISGILGGANNGSAQRLSLHSETLGAAAIASGSAATSTATSGAQTIEELTAQLQYMLKEKERLQADLSKIPISGGGPMTRRKAEMLEEQMDETERTISKIRYGIRMRS